MKTEELSLDEKRTLKEVTAERQAVQRRELDKQRRQWCAELRDLEETAVDGWLTEWEVKVSAAEHELTTALQAVQERRRELAQAKLALTAARHRHDVQRQRLRDKLLETAPPELDKEIAHWRTQEKELCGRTPMRRQAAGALKLASLSREVVHETTAPALAEALRYARWCIKQLEDWKVSAPAFEATAADNLKRSAPDAEAFSTFTIERQEKDGRP